MNLLGRKNLIAKISMLALAASMSFSTVALAQEAAAAPVASTDAKPATLTAWGHTSPDLVSDPSIRFGVLPNGMKYALQRNETPKGSASMRMHVNVGSIAETDDEQGLAHFLEHMAFNGSKNIPEGQMTKILERLGLAFGADTNASTGFDATIYKLDLPETDNETVDKSLFIMRETASELIIAPEAVERERGVVLSEKQTRNSAGLRRLENLIQFIAPETPFGKRLPIGTEAVLKTAPASRIVGFYRRYYRPENTTLVITGDFDTDAMEAKIKSTFGDWKGVGPAGKPMDRGKITPGLPTQFGSFSDPAASVEIEMAILRPYTAEVPSIAKGRKDLIEGIASGIMAKRFQKLALIENAQIRGGSVSMGSLFNAANQTTLSINAKEGDWQSALAVGEQELRRAVKFGFTQSELNEQIANIETSLKNGVEQANTRRSVLLAETIISSLDEKDIITTPQSKLANFTALKPQLTVDAVNASFRQAFSALPTGIHVTTKEPIAEPQQAIIAALVTSSQVAVTAPDVSATKAFAYDNFGKAGRIVSDTVIADMGIRTIRFANNVRLNIKRTDFEKGVVRYALRFGDGLLSVPKDKPSFQYFMNGMNGVAGLKAHSLNDLETIMAGKSVSIGGLSASIDSFGASGSTTPADAALQMKVLTAFLSAPGYRPEANTVWQNSVQSFAAQIDALPQTVAGLAVPRILASGDTRFGIGSKEELLSRNVEDMRAIVSGPAATGPIELAIVGDIDEKAAIDMVANSFGALPKRDLKGPDTTAARKVTFPADRTPITLYHKGKEDQGMVQAFWQSTDDKDQKADTIRDMTAEVFGLLLLDEVREKLGATYSPSTNSSTSSTYKDYGYFSASVIADPTKMDVVSGAIKTITRQLRDELVSDDVMLRARKPILEGLTKAERENGSWIGWASIAQSKPDRLDRKRKYRALLEGVTAADIQAAAKQYLSDSNMLEIRIVSDKKVSGTSKNADPK